MASRTSPYNRMDAYKVLYEDGEYSLERSDKSASLKPSQYTHILMEGETLQSVSFIYYGDSGRWGDIATFNGIVDPLDLNPGITLQIPI